MKKVKNNPDKTHTYKDSLKELIPYVIVILIVVLIRSFIVTPIKVNGTSMMNTLEHGDTMLLNKIGMNFNDIKRFQIVVIQTSNSYLIKRVIGLPGETLEYKDGQLYINDKVINDPYYKNNTLDIEKNKIPKDHYYVMGDNRANSIDSRIIGTINKKDILGTTKVIIFPISNIGIAD